MDPDPADLLQRGSDVLEREGGEPVEPVWPIVAQIGQGVVLDSGEVAADLGRHVIVEVGRRNRDHLDVDLLSVHGLEAAVRLEYGRGEWSQIGSAGIVEIAAPVLLLEHRPIVGVCVRHRPEGLRHDCMGVNIDSGQVDLDSG
ncbi:MAG TPA: hypothetical protein VMM14_04965 [Acidimicrobiia bacterium]|nr:hypothetical protein [Acidimicrobiia bacterium]